MSILTEQQTSGSVIHSVVREEGGWGARSQTLSFSTCSFSSILFLSSSFRLFHEQKDVLILVFLEDIPSSELSPHYITRKLLKKQTYLSWPRAAEHPQRFWQKLGQALGPRENDHLSVQVLEDQW